MRHAVCLLDEKIITCPKTCTSQLEEKQPQLSMGSLLLHTIILPNYFVTACQFL